MMRAETMRTASSTAAPLKLITTAELDQEAIETVLAELTALVGAGRVTGLALVMRCDYRGDETYAVEHPGCSGFEAISLLEYAKSCILENAWGR